MSHYHRCRGAVTTGPDQPLRIVEIEVPAPQADEVLIKVTACGLCHSDLHYMDGSSGVDYPYLVGHEISGVVHEIGSEVVDLTVGDQVVVALIVSCGECVDCKRGRGVRCVNKMPRHRAPRLPDGTELTPVLGAGGLAELVLMNRQHVALRPPSLDAGLSALLGCGVPTGFGAAVNTGEVTAGDRVAVIGCGGVGLSAIAGAQAAGAAHVTAFDFEPAKRAFASEFGADVTVDGAHWARRPELLSSFDIVIDAVGGDGPLQQAIALTRPGGRIVAPGAPRSDEISAVALRPVFLKRLEYHVSHWGDCVPSRDFPRIARLVSEGSFPLEKYRSEIVDLDGAAEAYERLRRGEVLRSIVMM